MFEERANIAGVDYLFSGMEFDSESGFNYFTARYHHPKMGVFITRDPLEDKNIWISPYAYCANNPLRYIDPDGRDEWEVNKQGEVMKHIEIKEHDKLVIVDKDGNRMKDKHGNEISKQFDYGTVKQQFNKSAKASNGKTYDMTFFKMEGDKNSTEAFEFFDKNTNVEWSQTLVGNVTGDKGANFLSNSHIENSDAGGGYLMGMRYTIREHNHSHPYNSIPSPNDMKFAESMEGKFGFKVPMYIYHKGKYTRYNSMGKTLPFSF